MLDAPIFDRLDYILPSTERSKNAVHRLEYFSACKIMDNDICIMRLIPHIPASLFETLLQSMIYKCYLKVLSKCCISIQGIYEGEISFPETLGILILNWPKEEFILRNVIPSLYPPVEKFRYMFGKYAQQKTAICGVDDMIRFFEKFCCRLITLIIQAVFKCSRRNTIRYNLRRLDVSGLGCFCSREHIRGFSWPDDILEGILNSKIDTFGHKIDIFADSEIGMFDMGGENKGFTMLRKITEASLNPKLGISVYFKKIIASFFNPDVPLPSDFYKVLSRGRCEYIDLWGFDINSSSTLNLCNYLPELVGINLKFPRDSESMDFLSSFEYMEQVSLKGIPNNDLINSICDMNKGLKSLDLSNCSLHINDLKCLANSIHSETLLELNLSLNNIGDQSEARGLITLCQNLNSVKVLIVDGCSLDNLSSNAVSKLANAFKDCAKLEILSMKCNPFNAELTKIIIDALVDKKSLRYLCLNIPLRGRYDLCKPFHETINKFRHVPIYISWF